MSDNNTLYIVGGVVAVAALGAFVLSKSNDRQPRTLTTPSSNVGPSTGGPVIGGTTGGAGTPGASLGQTQNMQSDLEAQRLAQVALQEKTANVRRLWGIATDAENRQMTVRVSIDGVSRNRAAFNGFLQDYIDREMSGTSWKTRVDTCTKIQGDACGGWDIFGACHNDTANWCKDRSPNTSPNGSRNPAANVHDEARAWAEQQLANAQALERQGFQAELARLEAQYNGANQALSALGVQFKSNSPSPL
jgi:hypothetical protein